MIRDIDCRAMHMRVAVIVVHRLVLMLTCIIVVNVNRGGRVSYEAIGYHGAGQRQGDGRRHHAQQIEQRNGAACSQSLGLGETQIDHS